MKRLLIAFVVAASGGCVDAHPQPKKKYAVTLYDSDDKPIRTWVCDGYRYQPAPILERDGKDIARIHGTWIIEPIE